MRLTNILGDKGLGEASGLTAILNLQRPITYLFLATNSLQLTKYVVSKVGKYCAAGRVLFYYDTACNYTRPDMDLFPSLHHVVADATAEPSTIL